MKVRFQQDADMQKFVDFNAGSFPERGELNKTIIEFRYQNPNNPEGVSSGNVLAFDDSENIIGQVQYHPAQFYFEGKMAEMQWGFDFFVNQDKRNDFIGVHILEYVKANAKRPIFGTGVGDKALKIQKLFGYRVIGSLRKYVRIINPIYFLTGLFRQKSLAAHRFPASITIGSTVFNKIDSSQVWNTTVPYNENLLEFARDAAFLKWRFFSAAFNYVLYKKISTDAHPSYFAVRTVKIKGITSLILADFRCKIANDDYQSILSAASKVATKLLLPILATGSSHAAVDKILEKNKFKKVGGDRPIITNSKAYTAYKDNIENRDFLLVTLADSDGEYLM